MANVKICAISDLHGYLVSNIPECDLLLIAGDIVPGGETYYQMHWLNTKFTKWLEKVPAKKIIGCFGNHDTLAEKTPELLPKNWPCEILVDGLVEWNGLRIWCSAWTRRFYDWAFNLDEPDLERKFSHMPECDIIVTHGPAFGYGDRCPSENGKGDTKVGSAMLLKKIEEYKVLLTTYGHVHEGRGIYIHNGSVLANCTIVDASYKQVYKPMLFELDTETRKVTFSNLDELVADKVNTYLKQENRAMC